MSLTPQEAAELRNRLARQDAAIAALRGARAGAGADFDLQDIPANSKPVFYTLAGRQSFDISDVGTRGAPIILAVSQDGPFFATHYPVVLWKPNLPAGATNLGQWSPIYTALLPAQESPTQDRVDISYEIVDGGSQRNFQNDAVPPIISSPHHLIALPARTRWEAGSTIQFIPTFEDIFFDGGSATPTTGGELVVAFPGFKMVPAGVP